MKIHYTTKLISDISAAETLEMSILFSENYGDYSSNSTCRPGEQIHLKPSYYKRLQTQSDVHVSLARHAEKLVGQALYILENTEKGYISWVIQIVVHREYRKKAIGKKLLLSVWGFSNDCAWGLATTNPLTIKTLESATLRKVSIEFMKSQIDLIFKIGSKVSFVDIEKIKIDDNNSVVDTCFFVDHHEIPNLIQHYGENWPFGNLEEGQEWLAFVFQDQPLINLSKDDLDYLFKFSEESLIDAYSRMKMESQNWTKGTKNEIDFIENHIPSKNVVILDLGCGQGRHLEELFQRGYFNIKGIDFAERNIRYCQDNRKTNSIEDFECHDIRDYQITNPADIILCLYDVIGSFPDEEDNLAIINSAYKLLKPGGIGVFSVMNMELTKSIAKKEFDVYKNPENLFKLQTSSLMQSTGNVFDPDYFIIDTNSQLVFRKEKFVADGSLATEYIVRDKRYFLEEIKGKVTNAGFSIIDARFVSAGAWDRLLTSDNPKAKEILLVARKI
jgi:2-polyprenyl-3-methyl-5-hydroxy-6-metoxy-1,4-benzoquinol methylase/GNAT superfamily N-acetyltransferase